MIVLPRLCAPAALVLALAFASGFASAPPAPSSPPSPDPRAAATPSAPAPELLLASDRIAPARQLSADQQHARFKQILRAWHDPADRTVLVVAHRGDWRAHPENSLAAFEAAIQAGVDMIETDLRKTRDGHFVILHDKTLDRTTTGTGPVAQATLAEIRKLRLRDALGRATELTVPTLEDALALTKDRVPIYLDKTDDQIDEVHPIVERAGMSDQAFYYGRRPNADLRARYGSLLDRIQYIPKIGEDHSDPAGYHRAFVDALRPPVFILEFSRDDAATLALAPAIRQGARLWVSPLDASLAGGRTDDRAVSDPDAHWGWLVDHGVTVFCTDRPRELIAYLRSRGLHP